MHPCTGAPILAGGDPSPTSLFEKKNENHEDTTCTLVPTPPLLFSLTAHMSPHDHRWPSCRRMESLVFRAQGSTGQTTSPLITKDDIKIHQSRDLNTSYESSWYFTVNADDEGKFSVTDVYIYIPWRENKALGENKQIFELSRVAERLKRPAQDEGIDDGVPFAVAHTGQAAGNIYYTFNPSQADPKVEDPDRDVMFYPSVYFPKLPNLDVGKVQSFLQKFLENVKQAVVAKKASMPPSQGGVTAGADDTQKYYKVLQEIQTLVKTALSPP